ncbi:MAG: hypothetical protein CMH31_00680 [Micavibrio sp.]|nr:hypothetical protein [Micavibrio sp.]|tara:strand:+ start:1258 stop:1629 length:372 start_codon:yes stop_codon:yes gene_type:complete
MSDTPSKDDNKLVNFEERLAEARKDFDDEYNPKPDIDKGMNDGARAGIELVGGMLGGGLIGYGLDYLFGTSPIFFFIFIILGVGTGFYNIYKITMNVGTSVGYKGLKSYPKDAKQSSNFEDDD